MDEEPTPESEEEPPPQQQPTTPSPEPKPEPEPEIRKAGTITPSGEPFHIRGWVFFLILLAPAVLSLVTLLFSGGSDYGEAAIMMLIFGSIAAGLVCGSLLTATKHALSPALKVLFWLLASAGCIVAAFALGMGGCFVIVGVLSNL